MTLYPSAIKLFKIWIHFPQPLCMCLVFWCMQNEVGDEISEFSQCLVISQSQTSSQGKISLAHQDAQSKFFRRGEWWGGIRYPTSWGHTPIAHTSCTQSISSGKVCIFLHMLCWLLKFDFWWALLSSPRMVTFNSNYSSIFRSISPNSATSIDTLSIGGGAISRTNSLPRPISPSPSLASEKTAEPDLQVSFLVFWIK